MTFFDQLNLTVLDLRILILFYLKEHSALTVDSIAEEVDYINNTRKIRSRLDVLIEKHLVERVPSTYPIVYVCPSIEMRLKVLEGFLEVRKEICKWM